MQPWQRHKMLSQILSPLEIYFYQKETKEMGGMKVSKMILGKMVCKSINLSILRANPRNSI